MANAYVVRMRTSREIVGLYFAGSIAELRHFVDECTDVNECEYASLGVGGIYWPHGDAGPVPMEWDQSEHGDGEPTSKYPWHDYTFTDGWSEKLWEPSTVVRWTNLVPDGKLYIPHELRDATDPVAQAIHSSLS